jgi:hypothetical protein
MFALYYYCVLAVFHVSQIHAIVSAWGEDLKSHLEKVFEYVFAKQFEVEIG